MLSRSLLPSWVQRARRGDAPRARIAKIPPVTRLRRMAAPSFELRPQQLRASDFGVELPSPEQIFDGAEGRRQHILLETLAALEKASATARYHELALRNLQRWAQQARPSPATATAAASAAAGSTVAAAAAATRKSTCCPQKHTLARTTAAVPWDL